MADEQAFKPTRGLLDARGAGLIVAGSTAAVVLTALLHPASGRALLVDGHQVGRIWYLAHFLGVGVWPVFVVGIAALREHLRRAGGGFTAWIGTAFFVAAAGTAMGSGLLGGFVRPRLALAYQAAPVRDRDVLAAIYDYNTVVNETFANAYQAAIGISIAMLGISLLRLRRTSATALGWAGIALGSLISLAFVSGVLSVQAADFHAFIGVNLAISAWFAVLAAGLIRSAHENSS